MAIPNLSFSLAWSILVLCLSCAFALDVKICVPYPEGDSGTFLSRCTAAVSDANTADLAFQCVAGGSADACIAQLENGEAHLTTLDGSDVIRANSAHGITPIVAEKSGSGVPGGKYGPRGPDQPLTAALLKEFCEAETTLQTLEGARSCHTGYRKSAGWKIPVGTLLSHVPEFTIDTSEPDVEDDAELIAAFFSDSCAPRTAENGPVNTPDGSGELWVEELCGSCKGDCTTADQYYDYSGAFRCLMEDAGDVAFVKHTTVMDYSLREGEDGPGSAWATDGPEAFRLLCRQGGCAEVEDYVDCHLALAPGHALVTNQNFGPDGDEADTGVAIQDAILEAEETTDFLENTKGLTPNFLWSESTTGLVAIRGGMDDYLPEESLDAFRAFDELIGASSAVAPTAVYCATSDEEFEFCEGVADVANSLSQGFDWGCTQLKDGQACMAAIAKGKADWMITSGLQTYQAHAFHSLIAIVAEAGSLGDGYDYYSVAVVEKEYCEENEDATLSSLEGKDSCHTGYRKQAGWDVALGHLLATGVMQAVKKEPMIENDAETAASFFGKSCVPVHSGLGPEHTENGTVKEWDPLCAACEESCDSSSPYYSYQGAHQCLADGSGDVAFVKHTTVFDYEDAADPEDLRLLCPEEPGCKSVEDYEDCNLGKVPAPAVLVRNTSTYTDRFKEALLSLTGETAFEELVLDAEANPEDYMFHNDAEFVELEDTTEEFLGDTWSSFEALDQLMAPAETLVRVCIPFPASGTEREGCTALFEILTIPGISFECVDGGSAEVCMQQLFSGEAHLTMFDGGDVYRAHHAYGLVPLLREEDDDEIGGSYYGVAVVNKEFCDDETTLADLKGMRSCHTGFRKMAGWRIPVGTLLAEVEEFGAAGNRSEVEDDAELVAAFFEETCAPRTSGNGPVNTEDGKGQLWGPLCTGCKGECFTNDQYYDYDGAFRCLMEGAGDVAFVKHTTVPDYAEDGNLDEVQRIWATKPASEFRLLCRKGGCAKIDKFKDCHLALSPSHAFVGAPALGIGGELWDVGEALKRGLSAAVNEPDFFEQARGYIEDFPVSASSTDLLPVDGGWKGYITSETEASLDAFAEVIDGEKIVNPGNLATFCTYTETQYEACSENLKLFRRLTARYKWSCLEEASIEDCYASVEKGASQFMVASPLQALVGYERHALVPIAGEGVGTSESPFVYSLAVVEDATCEEKLYITDFEDRDVCFAAFGSPSSWETPLSVLIEEGFLESVDESAARNKLAQTVSEFFADVCAPHDPTSELATDALCSACEDECALDSPFFGAAGALTCLRDGDNRLAMTDTSILSNPDLTEDLKLLCPYRRGCQELDAYPSCNFGASPTDVVLVHQDSDADYISRLRRTLTRASKLKDYFSILGETRDEGELVPVIESAISYFADYKETQNVLNFFDVSDD